MITRTNEKIIGVLFLLATAAFMTGSSLIDSHLTQSDFLAHLHFNRIQIFIGLSFELINSAAVVGIAVLLFPLLRHNNEAIALSYISSRIMESVLLIVGIIIPLVLLLLSEDFMATNHSNNVLYNILGNMLIRGQGMTFELAMLVLGIGSTLFCYLMYRKKLIPRLLSLLGIVGYIALVASSCLTIIGFEPGFVLFIPGGVFEIVFPLWLITKGFYRI